MYTPVSQFLSFVAGVVHSMLYVGAGVGFVLGGAALNLYVDFDSVPRDQ